MTVVFKAWLLFLVFNVIRTNEIILKATAYPGYQDKVEMIGAINKTTTSSLIRCLWNCASNDTCLTFFFNSNNKQCVMHSKHFYYQAPSMTETGWKYYTTEDVTGRCPPSYLYYRNLELCYKFDEIENIDSDQINLKCSQQGAQLAAVNSQVKYEYFVHIFENRTHERVFLQGKMISANYWILNDGVPLTYFNWYQSPPTTPLSAICIELWIDDQHFRVPCSWPHPAVFICELSMI